MTIVELNEKNFSDALNFLKRERGVLCEEIGCSLPDDSEIELSFRGKSGDGITYLFLEKGNCNALVTVDKPSCEIQNFAIDFKAINKTNLQKVLEFTLKQFSAVTLVFIWVNSLEKELLDLIENYGFEYTGEQDYINKERFISKYKYSFRRKR